jgi:hypothetical protein
MVLMKLLAVDAEIAGGDEAMCTMTSSKLTDAIPLGEVANFRTYGLNIGVVVLGY